MVFLQAAAREMCPSGICLQLVDAGVLDLFVSDEIISEIRDVLKRPRVPYINLAIAARADYFVSRDNDILALGDLERPEGRHFHDRFPQLNIVDPIAFLRDIQKRSRM